MDICGNTILVTGGSSGIGRRLAEALHDRGNTVIVAGRRLTLLDEISSKRPGMFGLHLDLDDPGSLPRLVAEVRMVHPGLNVVVANAGISRPEDLASEQWDLDGAKAVIDTNIMGVLRVIGGLLPVLKGQPKATLMATTSNLAFVPRADFPTYCASKAFLHSWLQSLRHQLRGTPVEVLELSPPYVQTELTGKDQASDPRAMPLDEYVAEVMRVFESGEHPRGEVLVARGRDRRTAEQDGNYEAVFAAMNPP